MELRDLLPLLGVALGWLLNQATTLALGQLEKRKSLGRAVSIIYYLNLEMLQVWMAQQRFKDWSSDANQWENYRQRTFTEYVRTDDMFSATLEKTVAAVSEYYPMEGFELSEIIKKYDFVKRKSLKSWTDAKELYAVFLSAYEVGFLAHRLRLQNVLLFVARKHGVLTWLKVRHRLKTAEQRARGSDLELYGVLKQALDAMGKTEESHDTATEQRADA